MSLLAPTPFVPGAMAPGAGLFAPSTGLFAPSILSVAISPASLAVGDTATANVSVSGNPAPTLTYQWTLDGVDIGGATGAAHVTTAAGALRVRATATNSEGVAGPVTSAPVTVEAALAGAALWGGSGATWGGAAAQWTI